MYQFLDALINHDGFLDWNEIFVLSQLNEFNVVNGIFGKMDWNIYKGNILCIWTGSFFLTKSPAGVVTHALKIQPLRQVCIESILTSFLHLTTPTEQLYTGWEERLFTEQFLSNVTHYKSTPHYRNFILFSTFKRNVWFLTHLIGYDKRTAICNAHTDFMRWWVMRYW